MFNDLAKQVENGFVVSARELHEKLGIEKSFGAWSTRVIEKEKVARKSWEIIDSENIEISTIVNEYPKVLTGKYVAIKIKVKLNQFKNTNFKNKIFDDYIISLNMAKHLAMMSKTEKGEEIRDYFIGCEEELQEMKINNVKAVAMIFTHKDKLQLTNNVLYPILERLGVLNNSKKNVHKIIKQALIGKYENITMSKEFDTNDFIQDYKELAEKMKEEHSNYFVDKNQITMFEMLENM